MASNNTLQATSLASLRSARAAPERGRWAALVMCIPTAILPMALVLAACSMSAQQVTPTADQERGYGPVDGAKSLSIAEAEALARRDEKTLDEELAARFFNMQGKAMGQALVRCGVNNVREAAGLMVVMRLNRRGEVTATWLNTPTELGLCFERELTSAVLPADGRSEFYTFIHLNY